MDLNAKMSNYENINTIFKDQNQEESTISKGHTENNFMLIKIRIFTKNRTPPKIINMTVKVKERKKIPVIINKYKEQDHPREMITLQPRQLGSLITKLKRNMHYHMR